MRILAKSLLALCLGAALGGTAIAGPREDANAAYEREDYATALRNYRVAADQGDATAQYRLGAMYQYGEGVAEDAAEAARWYRAAADKGHAPAMFSLARAYGYGSGVAEDEVEEVRWYLAAAGKGHGPAMHELAAEYDYGNTAIQDPVKAVRWYRAAAGKGFVRDMLKVAESYENGSGVAKNEVEAARWLRIAADKGSDVAMYELAGRYDTGRGVAKNTAEAVRWFRAAAALGAVQAINALTKRGLVVPDKQRILAADTTQETRCFVRDSQPNNRRTTGVFLNVVSTTNFGPAGTTLTLRTVAVDPDGDQLMYTYTVTSGRIAGDGATARWTLTEPGTHTATVEVSDRACATSTSLTRKIGGSPVHTRK